MWQYRHCGCADQAHDAPACTAGLQLLGCWTLLLQLRTGARFLLQTLGTALVTVQDAAVARAFLLESVVVTALTGSTCPYGCLLLCR